MEPQIVVFLHITEGHTDSRDLLLESMKFFQGVLRFFPGHSLDRQLIHLSQFAVPQIDFASSLPADQRGSHSNEWHHQHDQRNDHDLQSIHE